MSKAQFQILFAYHWHITHRLIECAACLDAADYTDNPGYGRGSIHDLLSHLLRSVTLWRLTLESGRQPESWSGANYLNLEVLQANFASEQAAWKEYLACLSEAELDEPIELTNRRGETLSTTRWQTLEHVVLHGMQHHSELAQLLTAKGHSPGNIDFIFFHDGAG